MILGLVAIHEKHENHEKNRQHVRRWTLILGPNKLSVQQSVFVRVFRDFRGQKGLQDDPQ